MDSKRAGATDEKQSSLAESGTRALVTAAIGQAKELTRIELALARGELEQEISAAKAMAVSSAIAAAAALLALSTLLAGLVVWVDRGWFVLVLGGALLILAVIGAVLAARRAPRKPLQKTRARLGSDVRELKETLT
jgi:uncharacterized membrane protein YqjE